MCMVAVLLMVTAKLGKDLLLPSLQKVLLLIQRLGMMLKTTRHLLFSVFHSLTLMSATSLSLTPLEPILALPTQMILF
jgi:hypothetical protein